MRLAGISLNRRHPSALCQVGPSVNLRSEAIGRTSAVSSATALNAASMTWTPAAGDALLSAAADTRMVATTAKSPAVRPAASISIGLACMAFPPCYFPRGPYGPRMSAMPLFGAVGPETHRADRNHVTTARRATRHSAARIPPSTYTTWPLTKSDARDARNTAAPTRSSGRPHRPAGVRPRIHASNSGSSASGRVISVRI